MSRPKLQNFHDQIVEALGRKIVTGGFPEGAQMPTEPQLAEEYGASRLIIREAMKSLSAKGLVSVRPRTGTHVLPRSRWNLFDPSVLAWHGAAVHDHKLMADLMELRRAIEPLAARLAADRATPADVAALRAAYEQMAGALERSVYIDADLRFHGVVVATCGNQFMQQLENALSAVWKTSFQASSDAWGPDANALALHKALLEAVERHDADGAERAVLALIDRAAVRIAQATRRQAASA